MQRCTLTTLTASVSIPCQIFFFHSFITSVKKDKPFDFEICNIYINQGHLLQRNVKEEAIELEISRYKESRIAEMRDEESSEVAEAIQHARATGTYTQR